MLQPLQVDTLHTLDGVVVPYVEFNDPLHDIVGADNKKPVFAAIFRTDGNIGCFIHDCVTAAGAAYFGWTLTVRLSGKPWSVVGVTRVAYDENDPGQRSR